MTRVGNLWAIDSLYYHYLPVEQRNAAFFDAKIVTENNDTIDVSYNMPLLRVASDRQLSQQVKQVLVGEDSITIDNQVFQDKNGKRRDMNYTVYSLWLINQIDGACKQINTTKLFPF